MGRGGEVGARRCSLFRRHRLPPRASAFLPSFLSHVRDPSLLPRIPTHSKHHKTRIRTCPPGRIGKVWRRAGAQRGLQLASLPRAGGVEQVLARLHGGGVGGGRRRGRAGLHGVGSRGGGRGGGHAARKYTCARLNCSSDERTHKRKKKRVWRAAASKPAASLGGAGALAIRRRQGSSPQAGTHTHAHTRGLASAPEGAPHRQMSTPTPTTPPACARALEALELCQRRRPRDAALVCRAPGAAAAWCLVRHASPCAAAAADLEACAAPRGGGKGASSAGPPTAVPRRCEAAASRLDACLSATAAVEGGGGEGGAAAAVATAGGATVVVGRQQQRGG